MIYYWKGRMQEGDVALAADSPAFRYGMGFFETVLYNGRRLLHFDAHLSRLEDSLQTFGMSAGRLQQQTVSEVLAANGLSGAPARVNLLAPVEDRHAQVPLAVFAVPYQPPPKGSTLTLCRAPGRVLPPLGGHKSMNYMYYHLEHARARAAGCDDSVLVDPDGHVLEGCACALLFRFGSAFVAPSSAYALPSISMSMARRVLDVQQRPVQLGEALSADHVYALSSLSGMRPVTRIADVSFMPDHQTSSVVTGIVAPVP